MSQHISNKKRERIVDGMNRRDFIMTPPAAGRLTLTPRFVGAPVVVQELTRKIKALKTMAPTILFTEQNIHLATEIPDRACVIEKGRIRFHRTMHELAGNQQVKQKYPMI